MWVVCLQLKGNLVLYMIAQKLQNAHSWNLVPKCNVVQGQYSYILPKKCIVNMRKEVFFKIPLTPGFLLTCCKEGSKCMRLIQPSSCCQETSKSRKAHSTTPAVQLQALQVTDA